MNKIPKVMENGQFREPTDIELNETGVLADRIKSFKLELKLAHSKFEKAYTSCTHRVVYERIDPNQGVHVHCYCCDSFLGRA